MKRDLDLIRDLLLRVEALPPRGRMGGEDLVEGEHARLLIESGYAEGWTRTGADHSVIEWDIHRLTMQGHDFLDSIRNPVVFEKTKSRLAEVGGAAALKVVEGVAGAITSAMLGLPP